jgi:hypothetical protein
LTGPRRDRAPFAGSLTKSPEPLAAIALLFASTEADDRQIAFVIRKSAFNERLGVPVE